MNGYTTREEYMKYTSGEAQQLVEVEEPINGKSFHDLSRTIMASKMNHNALTFPCLWDGATIL
jgi:hypothetical protein